MADKKDDAAGGEGEAAQAGGGLVKKLIMGAAIGFVIMAECVVTYLVLPSDDHLAAHYEARKLKDLEGDELEGEEEAVSLPPMAEIEIGKFSVTKNDSNANHSMRLEFNLVVAVLKDEEPELAKLLEAASHRLRERIVIEIRNSDQKDLDDPGLGLIKRRILEKSNDLLGKPLVRSVVFSEFSAIKL